jgi:hypothetical protein
MPPSMKIMKRNDVQQGSVRLLKVQIDILDLLGSPLYDLRVVYLPNFTV